MACGSTVPIDGGQDRADPAGEWHETLPRRDHSQCSASAHYGPDHQIDRNYTYSAKEWGRYVIFLRVSAIVYALQKRGALSLQSTSEPQQLEKLSAKAGDRVVPTAARLRKRRGSG